MFTQMTPRAKTPAIATALVILLIAGTIPQSFASGPTPTPTPSNTRGKKAPPAPPNPTPFSA